MQVQVGGPATHSTVSMVVLDLFVWAVLCGAFVYLYISYKRTIHFKITDVKTRIRGEGEANALAMQRLESLADLKYRGYFLPLLLCVLIATAGVVVSLAKAGVVPCSLGGILGGSPWVAIAAFGGAYTFSLYDLIRRHQRMEMQADSIHRAWHRMLTAPVMAAVLTPVLSPAFLIPIAFAVGVLPVNETFMFFTTEARKRLGLAEPNAAFQPGNLDQLQGVDKELGERFQDEGINTVQQLAFADTLATFVRVNVEWKRLLDLIDQALLHCYVGPRLADLHTYGIRGAVDVAELADGLASQNPIVARNARQLASDIGRKLELTEVGALNLVQTMAQDGQLLLIRCLWKASFSKIIEDGPHPRIPPMAVSLAEQPTQVTLDPDRMIRADAARTESPSAREQSLPPNGGGSAASVDPAK